MLRLTKKLLEEGNTGKTDGVGRERKEGIIDWWNVSNFCSVLLSD